MIVERHWSQRLIRGNFTQEEMNHMVNDYPSFISLRVREMLQQPDLINCCKAGLKLWELVVHYQFNYSLAYYLQLIAEDDSFEDDPRINLLIRQKFDRLSYGDMFAFFKRIMNHLKKHGQLNGLQSIYQVSKNKAYNRAMEKLLKHRNNIAHDRVVLTDSNSWEIGEEIMDALATILKKMDSLFGFKMILPIKRASANTYEAFVFQGAHSQPLFDLVDYKGELEEDHVYLIVENGLKINLSPFFSYIPSSDLSTKELFLCTMENDEQAVCCVEHFTNKKFYSDDIKHKFETVFQALMPDYKYQKDPYQSGHDLLRLKQSVHLRITNYLGDLETEHFIHLKKIRENSNQVEQDTVKLDYHDAPYYPIPDDLFQLKAQDKRGSELPIIYDIHNDGFRDFRIGTGRPLGLDEEQEISMSCFEPLLMKPLFDDHEDYYEFDFSEPVDEFEFYIHFPKGIHVKSHDFFYLGTDKVHPINDDLKIKILNGEDDNEILYGFIKRPALEESVKIEFTVSINEDEVVYKENESNKFLIGMKTYDLLKNSDVDQWDVEQKEDGSIILVPKM